jgi:hypothetical protein
MATFREAWKYNPWWWNLGFSLIVILSLIPIGFISLGFILLVAGMIALH